MQNKKCVLVCVTGQSSCSRLIEAGATIAKENDCSLLVLSVFPSVSCYKPDLKTLEELEKCARDNNAQMNIYYNDLPFAVAASVAKKEHAYDIVTGFSDDGNSPFITNLHTVLPEATINMVDNDGKTYHILPELVGKTV